MYEEKSHKEKITEIFNSMAGSYDDQWTKMASISGAMHIQLSGILSDAPTNAHILCVGAGTGAEIIYLAKKYPEWIFTAVEPSINMIEVCRRKLRENEIGERCTLHCGYIDSLTTKNKFDAATAILVSQFIIEKSDRITFYSNIAKHLKKTGTLITVDLSATTDSLEYESLLRTWVNMMHHAGIPSANLEKMRAMYGKDVALLPENKISEIIQAGGFENPTHFFQTVLIHGWYCRKDSKLI